MMRREALREYVAGALWVLPCIAGVLALIVGAVLSLVDIPPGAPLSALAFQGTADDARALLVTVSGTVVTVLALVLGLTVVALQLSSTQFSPRILRNFLRDRPNQVALSVFVATFAYSAAGLYTVGLSAGKRIETYPRLAVSGSIVLLFASLAMVVFFADHLAHSIQIDAITQRVERDTLAVVQDIPDVEDTAVPQAPPWAVPILSSRSGYVQTAHPELILPTASKYGVHLLGRVRVGEHIVAGTPLAWIWRPSPEDETPDPQPFLDVLDASIGIGFERTLQQDAQFGIRQLVDVACKALSPAVNDPYTAVQAIDHVSVVLCAMAARPLGPLVARDPSGPSVVIIPGRRFGDYLAVMCGLIRRYGSHEPTVSMALLRLLENCANVTIDEPDRWAAIAEQAGLILDDAQRAITQPADVAPVRIATQALQQTARTRGHPGPSAG
jgi:uncharacterized membrane protein